MTKHWTVLVTASLATLQALFAPALVARADIFQWEYINPANPSQGKQQSTMLCPDGAGANAVSAADLSNRNLTTGYLTGANLSGANASLSNLTNAELRQANLTNAGFTYAMLTGANLTGAEVRGARFHRAYLEFPYDNYLGGITPAQLYSTASYQAHDLTGIHLDGNNLAGVNLAGQNLTNAGFTRATLTSANLSQAKLTNARFEEATLENADLSHANLINARFGDATLTGANFTGAEVRGANFHNVSGGIGITAPQLYSTASYLAHDLTGIGLGNHNLAGVNLLGQNLSNASLFGATLTNADLSQANLANALFLHATLIGANLSQANLTNAGFSGYEYCDELSCGYIVPGANLTNANLSGADVRGANFYLATLDGANTNNVISTNGHIGGLDLTAGASLVVRDYDGNPAYPPTSPLPIVVEQHLATDATGTLRLVFDADPWDSLISFAPGISVARGGTLELTFAPGVNLAAQSGRTIDLFDWTGVSPTGAFTVSSPYTWNLSKLYTTGEVTLSPVLAGDYSGNGTVGPEDYNLWKANYGSTVNLAADGNGDGRVNSADYTVWRNNLGTGGTGTGTLDATVPEPATLLLLIAGLMVSLTFRRAAVS